MSPSEKMPTSDKFEPAAGRPDGLPNTQPLGADSSATAGSPPDPNKGKTFKPVSPRAAAAPAKRPGPGRPRKDSKGPGEAARAAGTGGSAPERPGNPEIATVDAAKKLGQWAGYLVGSLECLACRIDLMQGLAIWKFSDLEKDLYAEPGARVLNKYAPEWWVEYQDEIELAMALTPIFVSRMYMTAMIKYPHLAEKIAMMLSGQGKPPEEKLPGPELVPDQPATEAAADVAGEASGERMTFAATAAGDSIPGMPRELVTQ
jgi:hypothetical protein